MCCWMPTVHHAGASDVRQTEARRVRPQVDSLKGTDCAYIFLDESGNFDFSVTGSRYFVLTGISMRRPFPVVGPLDAYRHECLEFGRGLNSFHCAKDNRRVRGRVFDLIAAHLDDIRVDCLVVEKRKAALSLRQGSSLYPGMLGFLLRYVIREEIERGLRTSLSLPTSCHSPGSGSQRRSSCGVHRHECSPMVRGSERSTTYRAHTMGCSWRTIAAGQCSASGSGAIQPTVIESGRRFVANSISSA